VLKTLERASDLKKIHEKYKKYILRFAHQKWQTNKKRKRKEINIFKSLARSNVFSTKSEEQEVHLVWPNLCIFWLLFICLYRSWSWTQEVARQNIQVSFYIRSTGLWPNT
jgi:hypothetical protein